MTRNYRPLAVSMALLVTGCSIATRYAAADDPAGAERPMPKFDTYDFRGVRLHDSDGRDRSRPMFPLGPGRLDLLTHEEVQNDLQLTGDQRDSIEKLEDKASDVFSSLDGLSPEQREAKIEECRKYQAEKIDGLLDAKQKTRLKEIYLQRMGVRALENKEVIEGLKLTDHQVNEIKGLIKSGIEAITSAANHHSDRDELKKLGTEYINTIMAVLTDEQKASFARMKGKELPMPPR